MANEERFNRLQDEMSVLKSLMEKIITQNEERIRQNGGPFTTSAYAVGTSNTPLCIKSFFITNPFEAFKKLLDLCTDFHLLRTVSVILNQQSRYLDRFCIVHPSHCYFSYLL